MTKPRSFSVSHFVALAEGKRDGVLKALSAAADAEDMAKEAVAAFEATLERAEPLCARRHLGRGAPQAARASSSIMISCMMAKMRSPSIRFASNPVSSADISE